jgi:hypothetical protein
VALRYNVEGLREEIRWALVSAPRTRGQLDGIEANGISDRRLQKKGKHVIMDDNGNELALVESEVVRTIACRQYKTSIDPISSDAFRSARLIRTIRTNSTHVADWLLYCYSEKPKVPSVELLTHLLCEFYEDEKRTLGFESKELIKHMAMLACQQKRIEKNSREGLLSQVEVAKLAGKKTAAWDKSWSARWKRLLSILERFDREGLDHVYQSGRSRSSTREHAYVSLQ